MVDRSPEEGVIQFYAAHERRVLDAVRLSELCCQLSAWREVMSKTALVGQRPSLYDGAGYGNVSGRLGAPSAPRGARSFLITGTQTGGKACIALADYCVVERYDDRRNAVESYGETLPSSESMTHGALYDLSPHIRFVFHGHTPALWRHSRALRIPTTDPGAHYGTPEIAREVARLYRASPLAEKKILAMGGHEDGVIVFGRSAEEAGQVLLSYLARAYEAECREQGLGLCNLTR